MKLFGKKPFLRLLTQCEDNFIHMTFQLHSIYLSIHLLSRVKDQTAEVVSLNPVKVLKLFQLKQAIANHLACGLNTIKCLVPKKRSVWFFYLWLLFSNLF